MTNGDDGQARTRRVGTEVHGPDLTAATEPSGQSGPWGNAWIGLGLLLAATSLFTVSLPVPLSDSGRLEVFPAEILMVLVGLSLCIAFVTRRYVPRKHARHLLIALAVFLLWYVLVEAQRAVTGDEVKQSLLALRTTVIPMVCYFLVDARLDRSRTMVRGLIVLNLVVNLVHLPSWQNMRMSDFLGNSMVYGGLLVVLIPLNLYVLAQYRGSALPDRLLRAAAMVNLLLAIVMPIWTGSRSLSLLCAAVFIGSACMLVRARTVLTTLAGVLLVAGAVHGTVWATNVGGAAFGLYRIVPAPSFSGSDARNQAIEVINEEKNKADVNRGALAEASIDEIQEDPIFTDGRLYFPYANDMGEDQATAHNFVLEHLNAYGVIGFLFYLSLLGVALVPGWRRLRLRQVGSRENIAAFLTVGAAFGCSMVQPTMLILTIVVPLWLVVGALKQEQVVVMEAESAVRDG